MPSDGTTADVSDYNGPINTVVNEINGNLDDDNLAADAAIAGSKLANDGVTSAKLAEAFFKGKHQAVSTNSQPSGLTVQFGWTYVVGSGSGVITKAVTFPTAFASAPIYIGLTFLGARATASGAPDSLDDFITAFADLDGIHTDDITTTGFTATANGGANFGNTFNFGFSWMAIGTV